MWLEKTPEKCASSGCVEFPEEPPLQGSVPVKPPCLRTHRRAQRTPRKATALIPCRRRKMSPANSPVFPITCLSSCLKSQSQRQRWHCRQSHQRFWRRHMKAWTPPSSGLGARGTQLHKICLHTQNLWGRKALGCWERSLEGEFSVLSNKTQPLFQLNRAAFKEH